jgi:hypothetical protein
LPHRGAEYILAVYYLATWERPMALYEVINDGKEQEARLIEAKTKAGARSFAAKDTIKVVKATPHRIHLLSARGVKIEKAEETANE